LQQISANLGSGAPTGLSRTIHKPTPDCRRFTASEMNSASQTTQQTPSAQL